MGVGHVHAGEHDNCDVILENVRKLLADTFGITHSPLQHEATACSVKETTCF
jgi:hypothetical protein